MTKFHFFYGGPFSQWYPAEFVVDGVRYGCAEQYMMAMKAIVFEDLDAWHAIMSTDNPAKQKAVGRKVRGFNLTTWNKLARAFVYRANMAKFSIPHLRAHLAHTGNAELVEASPTDVVWGIGLSENDDRRLDKSKWRGTNWLGEVLMQVRADLCGG